MKNPKISATKALADRPATKTLAGPPQAEKTPPLKLWRAGKN